MHRAAAHGLPRPRRVRQDVRQLAETVGTHDREGDRLARVRRHTELVGLDHAQRRDGAVRVPLVADTIRRLNREIHALEERRSYLLKVKDAAMGEAQGSVGDVLASYQERQVLYFFLEEGAPTLDRIAEALDLREKVVADLLRRIGREFPLIGEA